MSENEQNMGVAFGPGSQASPGAAGASPPSVSIPNADDVRTLKERLARYMDLRAFTETVPDSVKFTCKEAGRVRHDKLKARREIAMKRAGAAIRFFSKPENRAALDARAATLAASGIETEGRDPAEGRGAEHESPVGDSRDAPNSSDEQIDREIQR